MAKPFGQLNKARADLASGTLTREQWLAAVEAAYATDAPAVDATAAPPPSASTDFDPASSVLLGQGEADVPPTPGLPRGSVTRPSSLAAFDGERPEPGLPSLAQGGHSPTAKTTYDADPTTGVINRPAYAKRDTNAVIDSALDFNPDVSHALWMTQRLGLHDWTLTAYKLDANGKTDQVDEDARDEAIRFAQRVFAAYGGGIDAMLEVAVDSVIRRGAVAVELDVADNRADVVDVDFVDPTLIDFKVERDGAHRRVYPVYQPNPGDAPVRLSDRTLDRKSVV